MRVEIAQDELRDMQMWVEDAAEDDEQEDEPGRKIAFLLNAMRDGLVVVIVTGAKTT